MINKEGREDGKCIVVIDVLLSYNLAAILETHVSI
jgi:hypothetical protein